jgi:hypothetical protein
MNAKILKTVCVTEKINTHDEELYLSLKNREDEDIIDELLQERYGYAYDDPEDVTGYIHARPGRGYGNYIVYYECYNFPIADVTDKVKNNWDDFVESVEDDEYEFYTDSIFDGKIENISIND